MNCLHFNCIWLRHKLSTIVHQGLRCVVFLLLSCLIFHSHHNMVLTPPFKIDPVLSTTKKKTTTKQNKTKTQQIQKQKQQQQQLQEKKTTLTYTEATKTKQTYAAMFEIGSEFSDSICRPRCLVFCGLGTASPSWLSFFLCSRLRFVLSVLYDFLWTDARAPHTHTHSQSTNSVALRGIKKVLGE